MIFFSFCKKKGSESKNTLLGREGGLFELRRRSPTPPPPFEKKHTTEAKNANTHTHKKNTQKNSFFSLLFLSLNHSSISSLFVRAMKNRKTGGEKASRKHKEREERGGGTRKERRRRQQLRSLFPQNSRPRPPRPPRPPRLRPPRPPLVLPSTSPRPRSLF